MLHVHTRAIMSNIFHILQRLKLLQLQTYHKDCSKGVKLFGTEKTFAAPVVRQELFVDVGLEKKKDHTMCIQPEFPPFYDWPSVTSPLYFDYQYHSILYCICINTNAYKQSVIFQILNNMDNDCIILNY